MIIFLLFFSLFYLAILAYLLYTVYATISAAPFVPSGKKRVKQMLEIANLQPEDRVIDLGSGDGRITLAAAKYCSQSDGVEINPFLIWFSKIKQKLTGVINVKFTCESLWNTNLSSYNVIFIYFIPHRMEKLAKKIKNEMLPGSHVISHDFSFPNWQPNQKDAKIYLYVV